MLSVTHFCRRMIWQGKKHASPLRGLRPKTKRKKKKPPPPKKPNKTPKKKSKANVGRSMAGQEEKTTL